MEIKADSNRASRRKNLSRISTNLAALVLYTSVISNSFADQPAQKLDDRFKLEDRFKFEYSQKNSLDSIIDIFGNSGGEFSSDINLQITPLINNKEFGTYFKNFSKSLTETDSDIILERLKSNNYGAKIRLNYEMPDYGVDFFVEFNVSDGDFLNMMEKIQIFNKNRNSINSENEFSTGLKYHF